MYYILASSPGLREGEEREGLVFTVCTCAMFSAYFTVKVSVKVQVKGYSCTERLHRTSIRTAMYSVAYSN